VNVATIALVLVLLVPVDSVDTVRQEKLELLNRGSNITQTIEPVPAKRTDIPTSNRGSSMTSRSYSGNGADIIRTVASQQGCTGEETQMLLEIARKESTLRPNAVSKTGKYVGLFQLGPHLGSYEERIDPYWNTARAIRYMRGRYGSISAAYSFRAKNNWY